LKRDDIGLIQLARTYAQLNMNKKNKPDKVIFLLAVAFSLYLMVSLPAASAQSIALTIKANLFAPDGSTRLETFDLTAPSGMVNKQVKVMDKSAVPDTWEDPRVNIKINPQPGFLIGDVYIVPCIDEKFGLQDPTDCIRSNASVFFPAVVVRTTTANHSAVPRTIGSSRAAKSKQALRLRIGPASITKARSFVVS